MLGFKMEQVVKYVDARVSQVHNLIISKFATKTELQSVRDQLMVQKYRLEKLEEYLKVEYTEETTKGYAKIKK